MHRNTALLVSDGKPAYRYFAHDAGISHDAIKPGAGVHVNCLGWFRCLDNHRASAPECALGKFPHLTVT